MNRIVSPHEVGPKNKTQARLDYIQQVLAGFQQSLIYKDQRDHFNSAYTLYMIERLVEILSEAKILAETPQEFFNRNSSEFQAKVKADMEKENEPQNETNTDPQPEEAPKE